MKKNKQEKRLLDKENNEALWDDGVKYTIYWELFLIFINTRSMLFGRDRKIVCVRMNISLILFP